MEKGIEDLNRGAEAYQAGDYETAVAYYKKAAAAGNVTALSNLGYCYYYGRSIPVDKEKARRCWEEASERGDVAATCKLGDLLWYGEPVKDRDRAKEFYRKAFRMGLESADIWVRPDAILRMFRYCPEDLPAERLELLDLGWICVSDLEDRIAEGDRYSEKLLREAEELLSALLPAAEEGTKN